MKNVPSNRIVVQNIPDVALFALLKDKFNNSKFNGNEIEILLKTKMAFRSKAHGENLDLPTPGAPKYYKMNWPLAELITTAGLTKQALDRATGGVASWGRIVEDALDDMMTDFQNILCYSMLGSGNGKLAEVASASDSGGGTNIVTVTCDNEYKDWGWDNVHLIKSGMLIEIYDSTGSSLRTAAGGSEVIDVTFGNRNNGAATTGTFTIALAAGHGIVDGDIVYIHGAKTDALTRPFPTGLFYYLQDGTHFSAAMQEANMYGLARSTYPALRARIYQATDFGLSSESPVDGTPTLWDLSVFSDAMMDVRRGGGKGKIDCWLVNSKLGIAIDRRNKTESNVQVVVSTTGSQAQKITPARKARTMEDPDGREIPILCDESIPNNCAIGLTTNDLEMHQLGAFDYLREYGDIWEPSRGGRKTNYEAPYGGYLQLTSDQSQNHVLIQDLRDDI